jgi:uncharacterized protein (TIGR02246 family)
MYRSASRLLCVGVLSVLGLSSSEAAGTDTPEALIEAWVRAWNAHDMKALAGLFTEDGDFLSATGVLLKDPDQVQADLEKSHATHFKGTSLSAKITSLRFPRPDVAVIRHDGQITGMVDSAGKPRPPLRALSLVVAVKMADGWRIVAKQNTYPPREQ